MKHRQRTRRLAAFLLSTLLFGIAVPGLVGFFPHPALAQAGPPTTVPGDTQTTTNPLGVEHFTGGGGGLGGLGGLLGGLFQGPIGMFLMIFLLSKLLGGLFGGGGATPQTGPAEEQPSVIPPSVGPRRTGSRTGPGDNTPIPDCPRSLFYAQERLYPSTVSTSPDTCVTVYNTDLNPQSFTVRRRVSDEAGITRVIGAEGAHAFRFPAAGIFEIFRGDAALATITVGQ